MATDPPLDGPDGERENGAESARPTADSVRRRAGDLGHEVVSYPDRPDRCTIFPPDATGVRRMSTWLTADRDVFVDLAAVR